MCRIKSAIVLKDRVYMPHNHDHHTKMLEELGIKDDSCFPNFVRVEITPKDGDIWNHDLNNWEMNVDQDFRPEWFDKIKAEKECKEYLQEWFKKCFAINDNSWTEYKNTRIWVKNSKIIASGNATVEASGNATVKASGNATVEAWGNATVEAWGNATVKAWDNATVKASGNATVKASGNAGILIPDYYCNMAKIINLEGSAHVKDLRNSSCKLIIANDFEIVKFAK